MAYQVLARKWRPRNFPEMVGQTHVVRALVNALEHNRLHHAYLFTGTRGVGKTTIARILAKSLNCAKGVTAYPCGECGACREINEGRFVDLIEVDAASRTKVEDTRELLENVQYAPSRGRYKVYLIDEVHMLSTSSFNALLKTLEEPPPHIKFLLATTDPQKLPATVLSRCLQFSLKRVPVELIAQHLTKIVEQEGISYESTALQTLAQSADGSLRDALSLLDQAIAYGGGDGLRGADVHEMLGTLNQEAVWGLLHALAANDAPGLLQQITQLAEYHPDFSKVLEDILSILQRVALAQVVAATVTDNHPDGKQVLQLAQQLSPEDVQLYYQIALLGRRDLPLAPQLRGGFEMVMLRMLVFRPVTTQAVAAPVKPAVPTVQTAQPVPISSYTRTTETPTSAVATIPTAQAVQPIDNTDEWKKSIQSLPLRGLVKQLADNCLLKQREGDTWHLTIPTHLDSLLKTKKDELERVFQEHFGVNQRLMIRTEYPEGSISLEQQQRIQETQESALDILIADDPFVIKMQDLCGARVNRITPRSSLN